jgi:hypothetical protein
MEKNQKRGKRAVQTSVDYFLLATTACAQVPATRAVVEPIMPNEFSGTAI